MSEINPRVTAPDQSGDEIAVGFGRRLLARQISVSVLAFVVLALLAPWSLMISSEGLVGVWLTALAAGGVTVVLTALLSIGRLRAARDIFRAVALEPERVSAQDINTLGRLPGGLALRFALVGSAAAAMMGAPGLRHASLDNARAITLALLAVTVVVASAVVHYVVLRELVIHAIEIAPLDPVTNHLEEQAMRLAPRRRVIQKILLALVAPVVLVGVGALLVSHAHERAFIEKSRQLTAKQVTEVALNNSGTGRSALGRDDALAATAAYGFFIKLEPAPPQASTSAETSLSRTPSGLFALSSVRDEELSTTRYTAELTTSVVTTGVWLALAAALVSALLGWWFGRQLAQDLVLATQQVSLLGTETVLRGEARVAGPARFSVVAQLGRSVEALAERFRMFAGGQERALEAKEAAQRMKQLLFASVSHDLKSPLNAILGLAELVRDEPLSPSQRESLQMVSSRGRELLALIETILDAARVEAGQLRLNKEAVAPDQLIREALDKAFDLLGTRRSVLLELPPILPALKVDPAHAGRAVAVLIAHAMETMEEAHGRTIRVRGSLPAAARRTEQRDAHSVRLDIEYVASKHRPSLLDEQLQGRMRTDSHRGMALRLSLARAIIELHGGRVEVGRGPHGAAVVTCWLPRQLG